MKSARPSELQQVRDALREEVLMWLGLWGREPVSLEMYNTTPHDSNFTTLQRWGFLDEIDVYLDLTLTLNDKAIAFLDDPSVIKKLS
jgi:hypothetical protein